MLENELRALKRECLKYAEMMLASDLISERQAYGIKKSMEVKGAADLQLNNCVAVLEALNQIYENMIVAYDKKKRGQRIITLQ
jgi:tRNA splicing ligase